MTDKPPPDWAGLVVHYPDGVIMMVQIDQPEGSLELTREPREVLYDDDIPPTREFRPGHTTANVTLSGRVLTTEYHHGGKPDWAKVKREIER